MGERNRKVRRIGEECLPERCVLCGKCTASCPSFKRKRNEAFSPRGRMALTGAFLKGEIKPGNVFQRSLEHCVMCGACTASCPTGSNPRLAVILLKSLEEFRNIHESIRHHFKAVPEKTFPLEFFREVLDLDFPGSDPIVPGTDPVSPQSSETGPRRLYLSNCISRNILPEIARAGMRFLEGLPGNLDIADDFHFCGLPHFMVGETRAAREIALRNINIVERSDPDEIVFDSADCARMFRDYAVLFPPGSRERGRVDSITDRIRLLPELVTKLAKPPSGKGFRVLFEDSCSMRYGPVRSDSINAWLASLEGVDLIEGEAEECLPGWALLLRGPESELAKEMIGRKVEFIREKKPDAVVMDDPAARFLLSRNMPDVTFLSLPEVLFLL